MRRIGCTRRIHIHSNVIERQRCIFARTDCHPIPFSVGRCSNSNHFDITILKFKCFSPKSNPFFCKCHFRRLIQIFRRLNRQSLIQIHSCSRCICEQFNDSAIRRRVNRLIQRIVSLLSDLCYRTAGRKYRHRAEKHAPQQSQCQHERERTPPGGAESARHPESCTLASLRQAGRVPSSSSLSVTSRIPPERNWTFPNSAHLQKRLRNPSPPPGAGKRTLSPLFPVAPSPVKRFAYPAFAR